MSRELDIFNSTRHHLTSMIHKRDSKSATDLFETFFNGVVSPEFSNTYGIDLEYTSDYSALIDELDKIHKPLILKKLDQNLISH